ncbi:MAG: LssY C-terminal domain-containing protein [Candidatus Aquicultor sp.]
MFKLIKSVTKSIVKAVREDPEVKKLVARHPGFFSFLQRRTDPDAVFGLNLTIGVVVTAFFIFLFLGVAQDLIGRDPLVRADLRVVNLVQIFRTPSFSKVMLFITYLGKGQVIFIGVIAVGAVLVLLKRWYHLIALITSVAAGEFLVYAMKGLFQRSRPPLVNAIAPERSYSFPSGHAFIAISFYGLAAYFVFRSVKSTLAKILTVIVAAFIIIAIGFSRIYLGVHFPSDVLGGYAAGAAWVTAIITSLEIRMRFKPYKDTKPFAGKRSIVLVGVVMFILWAAYTVYYYETHPFKEPVRVPEKLAVLTVRDIPGKLFVKYPRVSEDITGKPMEPVNIIIIGSRPMLDKAFRNAGWRPADKISLASLYKLARATILKKPYPQAPGTPSFWNARPNDFAYEKPTKANKVSQREHIHFWNTPFILKGDGRVWFATAHLDTRIVIKNSILPTHEIDPNVDKERDKVKNELQRTGDSSSTGVFQIVQPTLGQNQAGSRFFTDGKAYVIYLK